MLDITFPGVFIVNYYLLIRCKLLLTVFINECQLFIGGVFIVGVNDWWFTFIDGNLYMLFIVIVTLDIDLELFVSFWF